MTYTNISNLDSDLRMWDKGLEFYRDELTILEKRLMEVTRKNNSQEAMEGVEHFQNQFMIQRKNIQDIRHELKNYKASIGYDVQHHAGRVSTELVEDGKVVRDKWEGLEKIMNGLRREFNTFLSKWM